MRYLAYALRNVKPATDDYYPIYLALLNSLNELEPSSNSYIMPTPEETTNLQVISEYFAEFWGKASPEIVDKLCADDFVINYPMHGPRHGKEAAKKMLAEFKEVCSCAPK